MVESLRDQEIKCSASERQGSNFEVCVWKAVSCHLSAYVHQGCLKPHSFHFILSMLSSIWVYIYLVFFIIICRDTRIDAKMLNVKWNEWGFRPPLCTYSLLNEMTLPSRHRLRNSSPGGLRPSTLPLGHGGSPQYWIFTIDRGRNILFLWNSEARVGFEHAISDFPSRQL